MTRWIPDSSAYWASPCIRRVLLSGPIPLTLQTALRLFAASVIDLKASFLNNYFPNFRYFLLNFENFTSTFMPPV